MFIWSSKDTAIFVPYWEYIVTAYTLQNLIPVYFVWTLFAFINMCVLNINYFMFIYC